MRAATLPVLALVVFAALALDSYVSPARAQSVSLQRYVERILDERELAHRAEMTAAQRSLDAASAALDARLTSMNEFRAQMNDERVSYARKDQITALELRIRALEDKQANLDGRFWALGVGLTIFVTVLQAVGWWLSRRKASGA